MRVIGLAHIFVLPAILIRLETTIQNHIDFASYLDSTMHYQTRANKRSIWTFCLRLYGRELQQNV